MPAIEASELNTQYWEPMALGPITQVDLSASGQLGATLPTQGTIPNAGSYQSNVIISDGFKGIGIGCKSTNTGNLTIQRFLDRAGQVPIGAPLTAALAANTAQWLSVNDGVPFQSFSFNISNTGAGTATVTNFACLLNSG